MARNDFEAAAVDTILHLPIGIEEGRLVVAAQHATLFERSMKTILQAMEDRDEGGCVTGPGIRAALMIANKTVPLKPPVAKQKTSDKILGRLDELAEEQLGILRLEDEHEQPGRPHNNGNVTASH